jgi:hypothetical protein
LGLADPHVIVRKHVAKDRQLARGRVELHPLLEHEARVVAAAIAGIPCAGRRTALPSR